MTLKFVTFHEWRCVRCGHAMLQRKQDQPDLMIRRVYACPQCKAPTRGTGRSERRLVLPRPRRRRDLL